jgi:hypothetical protein
MKKLGFILALMILSLQGWAQGTCHYFNLLDDFHGKGFADWGTEVLSFSDSTYVVAGISQDSVHGAGDPYVYARPSFMVISERGDIISKHDYARPFEQLFQVSNEIFVKTPDGGYAISGLWQRWDSVTATTCFYGRYLLKLDAMLDSTWIALDSGPMVPDRIVSIGKMIVASDDGYILCGNDNFGHTILTKFDVSGTHLWNKMLPFASTFVWSMQNLPNGNFMMAGQKGYNSYLGEYDVDGEVVWDSTFNNVNTSYQNGAFALRLFNGGYFIYDAVPDNTGTIDMHCMWWDASRHQYQERTIEMRHNQFAYSIIELQDGSIILCGPTGTDDDDAIDKRAFLLKLGPTGEILWLRTYYYWHAGTNPIQDCASAHDGGFVMTGSSWDTTGTSPYQDTWILKVDSVGCPFPNCGPSLAVNPTETVESDLIQAFPNPTTDRIHLRCVKQGLHEQAVIRLLALDGRVLDEVIMPMGFEEIDFDVSQFPAGVYLWEYLNARGVRDAGRFEVVR